jgi:hypothetical protein
MSGQEKARWHLGDVTWKIRRRRQPPPERVEKVGQNQPHVPKIPSVLLDVAALRYDRASTRTTLNHDETAIFRAAVEHHPQILTSRPIPPRMSIRNCLTPVDELQVGVVSARFRPRP